MNSTIKVTSFDLIKILREKIGEEQASALTNYIETKVHEEYESKKEGIATKEDIANLKTDIANTKVSIILWLIATMIALFGISTGLLLHFMK